MVGRDTGGFLLPLQHTEDDFDRDHIRQLKGLGLDHSQLNANRLFNLSGYNEMKTYRAHLTAFCIFTILAIESLPFTSAAQETPATPASPTNLTYKQWEDDLDTLTAIVPRLHGNAFHACSEQDFLSAVKSLRSQLTTMNEDQILAGFARLIGMIQDGHNRLDLTRATDRHEAYPLRLTWHPNGIFVERAAPQAAKLVGGRLLSIEGVPADSVLRLVLPLIPHDAGNLGNAYSRMTYYMTTGRILHGLGVARSPHQAAFVVEKEGVPERMTLNTEELTGRLFYSYDPVGWADARNKTVPRALWRQHLDSTFWLKYLPDHKTLYVQINAVANEASESLAEFARRMAGAVRENGAKRLILDLRWNDGGNNYLLRPLIVALLQMPEIDRRGHLFVLTGPRTFSAAQNLVNRLENFTEALFVGEPTGENVNFYGDTRRFVLPNSGCRVNLANLWWQDKDPRDKRTATFPEVAVEESFEDYVQNRDPAMEHILQHDEFPTFEESLLQGVKKSGEEGAKRAFREFCENPVHRFFVDSAFVEDKINILGYSLLGEKRMDDAIKIFKLNTEMYPASFNTWDSLGEAYANAGRKDEAIVAYKKSLALNPTSASGLEALSKLQR